MMRALLLTATLTLACTPSSQPGPSATAPAPALPPSPEAAVKKPHPVLGLAVRVDVNRFRPDASFTITAAERIAAFAAAVGPATEPAASVPRTQPQEEIVFLDAAGASLGAVVFLGADQPAYVSVRDAGTRVLAASEVGPLRALLLEVK